VLGKTVGVKVGFVGKTFFERAKTLFPPHKFQVWHRYEESHPLKKRD